MGTAASILRKIVQADGNFIYTFSIGNTETRGMEWDGMDVSGASCAVQRVAPGAKCGMSQGALSDMYVSLSVRGKST